jgi:hypothetical protein
MQEKKAVMREYKPRYLKATKKEKSLTFLFEASRGDMVSFLVSGITEFMDSSSKILYNW